MFCLPVEQTKKFIQALKDGVIEPEKLSSMTSQERRSFFTKLVGEEDARQVNALFESKLLLKNQQQGMINWAKNVAGMKPEVRRDIIAKIERLDRALDPKEERSFLEDLVAMRLEINVSFEEAQKIHELSQLVTDAKNNLRDDAEIGSPERLDYGAKKVALLNYTNELKLETKKTTFRGTLNDLKTSPVKTTRDIIERIAGFAKAVKASLDDSAVFRQGWRTLFTNPMIWSRNALNSFSNIYRQLKVKTANEDVMNGIKADIYSRPNALDGTYKKMKLDIGTGEEAYPTTLPERIPIFGRLYKASQIAYEGFLMRMRADIADKYIEIAKENGIDLTDDLQNRSIGKLVNSLTGRGNLGPFEKIGKQTNVVFFSPKFLKSHLDFLTAHMLDNTTWFVKKQAAINILKVVGGMTTILATAYAIDPNSVELDPRSTDFLKIRIGNSRFDVSGGMGGLITLAAREITGYSKSPASGKITSLTSGKFGMPTRWSVAGDFLKYKFSPMASVVRNLAEGRTFGGEKPTILNQSIDLFAPLPITNAWEAAKDPKAAPLLLTILADALGISANTFESK